jgi:pimeloyl-ACP methyl ester carboxylesterase
MGDRAHLLTREITLDTFIQDIIAVISTEELSEVILVAHSFGGVPALGVADRVPEKLRHLVYLDAAVVESGQAAFSYYPPADVAERIAAAEAANGGVAVPVPKKLPAAWGFQERTADYAWVARRLSPHPLRTYQTPLMLSHDVGNNVPRTYIHCVPPDNPVIEASRKLIRSWDGWDWIEFAGPHDAMILQPGAIASLILEL